MLHEDDDPLSNSLFDNASTSFLGNTMNSSMLNSHYEEDPWGSGFASTAHTSDVSRSFTAPNFATSPPVNTTSDVGDESPLTKEKVEYNPSNVLSKYHKINLLRNTLLNSLL